MGISYVNKLLDSHMLHPIYAILHSLTSDLVTLLWNFHALISSYMEYTLIITHKQLNYQTLLYVRN